MRILIAALALLASSAAQVAVLPSPDAPGGIGVTTFYVPGARTALFLFSADALRAQGICGGAQLTELAVLPVGVFPGQSSPYVAPQARLLIGHVATVPATPGAWEGNLDAPIVAHDLTSGPYTLPWTLGSWSPVTGIGTSGFVWDGIRDVGVYFGTPGASSGMFLALAGVVPDVQVHAAASFPPVPPTDSLALAMRSRWTSTPGGACAVSTPFGGPCDAKAWSFYELFANATAFDLAGTPGAEVVIRGTPTASGYSLAAAPSAWWTPIAPAPPEPPFAQVGGNAISAPLILPFVFPFPGSTTSVVHAAADGFVILASATSSTSVATPSPTELLAGRPLLCPLWTDLEPARPAATNPTAGVYFDIEPGNQAVYITWLDCLSGTLVGNSVTVQCMLRSDGSFEFRYREVLTNASSPALVGWSQGASGASPSAVDPGSRDLSTSLPFATSGPEVLPLQFEGTAPALGLPWRLTAGPVSTALPLAIMVFGTVGLLPGVSLSALGAPGCRAHTVPDLTSITLLGSGATPFATASATLPVNPQLIGVTFHAQAAAFGVPSLQELVTSPGIRFTVGR